MANSISSPSAEIRSQPVSFDVASLDLSSLLGSQVRDRIAAAEATKNQVLDFELLPAPPAATPSGETISREDALSPEFALQLSDLAASSDENYVPVLRVDDALDSGLGSDFLENTDLKSGADDRDLLLGGESGDTDLLGNGLSAFYAQGSSIADTALTADFSVGDSFCLGIASQDVLISDPNATSAALESFYSGSFAPVVFADDNLSV